ncbi:MAG: MFS transporter [Sulfurovum sp.]|nr:MAG: MFS transporter [Sulfurovum sp.]
MSILLALFYFFYFSLIGVYVIFLPKVLLDSGYSTLEVGIIYSSAPFVRFVIPFVFQYYLKLTHKIFNTTLILALVASFGFWQFVDNFTLYLLSNLIFGIALGIALPFVETISLQVLDKKLYGKVRLWGSIGFILIALLLGRFLSSPDIAFYYLIGLMFFTTIFGVMVASNDPIHQKNQQEDEHKSDFSLVKYWAFWVSILFMQIGFGGFYNFFTVYETAHGVSLEMVSYMWSFGVICEIVMLYFQAPLLEKNLLLILKIATFLTAIRWFILFIAPSSVELAFGSQALHAFSFALYHSASITYVFGLYRDKKLAQQFFLGVSFGLGGGIGALLAGKIYGEYLFLIESMLTIIALVFLFIHSKRKVTILAKEKNGL